MKKLGIGILFAASAFAYGQSFNIDFGSPSTGPNLFYPAATSAGVWNAMEIPASFVRVPIVDLNGVSTGATLYQFGLSQMLDFDIPSTTGDHQSLMDDMALSFCNPVDGCVWLENLQNGNYEVVIYGLTPNNANLMSQTRVDFATSGPVWIGGSWPGSHQQGVTFSRHRVNVTAGKIGLHSGIYNGAIQAGINGIQVTYLDGPPIDVYPESFAVAPGPFPIGTLQSLRKSDDDRFLLLCDVEAPSATLEMFGRSPVLDPSAIQVVTELRSTHRRMGMSAQLFNYALGVYETAGFSVLTQVETTRTFSPAGDLARFRDASTGQMKMRLRFLPTADMAETDGWNNIIDQAIWRVEP